jgi:glycosyltransferase involved in cell wall biosynthesis
VVPQAHFRHPEVRRLSDELFGIDARSPETSERAQRLKELLKGHLYRFIRVFRLELLIVENALAIPMNVPLGLALTEVIAESGIPAIGHHHDFVWERQRFWPNAAGDYLRSAFPPTSSSVRHVVINSIARAELARRTGASATLVPNVMDFGSPDAGGDHSAQAPADGVRATLGIEPDETLVLQPTRVIPRKGIERSIELTCRLERPATLVVSHASGDEGQDYETYLRSYAGLMGVRVVFAADVVAHLREEATDGQKVFALADVYRAADLVAYPSIVEGFGNAFLEAVYHRCPIVVNRYDVFRTDIEPKGFKVLAFDGFIDEATVRRVQAVLENSALRAQMIDHNFKLGEHYYSYDALARHLSALLMDCPNDATWSETC